MQASARYHEVVLRWRLWLLKVGLRPFPLREYNCPRKSGEQFKRRWGGEIETAISQRVDVGDFIRHLNCYFLPF